MKRECLKKFESVDIDALNADLDDLLNENLTQVP